MANEEGTQSGAPAKQIRVKPSLTTALVMSFGALILFGMVLVQGISMWSAQKNTRELLSDNARFAVLSLLRETRRRLAPVKQLNEYMSGMIDSGQIDIDDHAALSEALLTGIAGTDQVFGIAFVYPNGTALRALRGRGALPLADNRFILYGKDHVLALRLM